jgi:hypothetical protein
MNAFFEQFGDLALRLQQTNMESYIFMDGNINLLDLENADSQTYMNLLFAAGYLQCILKATRMQNVSKSLIDHIHCNSLTNNITSGVFISDISDHFFTFIGSKSASAKHNKIKTTVSHYFSAVNLNLFKRELGGTDWNSVIQSNNVDSAFDCFWSSYSNLYKQTFPLKRKRFNKNFNSINKFMTAGLLISRKTKEKLHLLAVSNPLPMNINSYKTYKSVYQRTIRAAKKLYISDKITENAKNPKKTWQTLNEILGKELKSATVSQININGTVSSDSHMIANHFNQFFTHVGQEISFCPPHCQKTRRLYKLWPSYPSINSPKYNTGAFM